MIKSDVKITSSLYVKHGFTQQAYTRIYIYFVSNLENSCNVYHLFLQYGYDQYTYPHAKRKQFSQTQNIDN